MISQTVIKVVAETYLEEQILLNNFPGEVWIKIGSQTLFFIPYEKRDIVEKLKKEMENGK